MNSPALSVKNLSAAVEPPQTFCRFVPERADDFAWENDKVAFRAYGPALENGGSGIDCWFKRVRYPMVDKWYRENEVGKSYHEDHGEGYDPYIVGPSRGCGGTGLWVDGEIVPPSTFKTWNIIKSTREESIFVLSYEWMHEGSLYREEKIVSIRVGDLLFGVASTFYRNGEPVPGLPVVVGVTTHGGKATVSGNISEGWMACWEEIDGYGIGTGAVMAPESIQEFQCLETVGENSGVTDGHAVLVAETNEDGQVLYYAGYGWSRAGEITTPGEWEHYLKKFKI